MASYQKGSLGEGLSATRASSLVKAFGVRRGEVISLVGGGGKTTLMFALARELALTGELVITTTTTKILEPSSPETMLLIVETDERRMLDLALENLASYKHITLATEKLPSGKLKGVSPECIVRLAKLNKASCIIVEADGAAGRPIKAPGPNEPVIPDNTTLVIPIVGIDALGCKLNEGAAFRPEIVSRLTGLPLHGAISIEAIATLVTHSQGIIKGSPAQTRVIPLINKMDLEQNLFRGRDLASNILERMHPQIVQVVLGQVRLAEPVVEIVSREVR